MEVKIKPVERKHIENCLRLIRNNIGPKDAKYARGVIERSFSGTEKWWKAGYFVALINNKVAGMIGYYKSDFHQCISLVVNNEEMLLSNYIGQQTSSDNIYSDEDSLKTQVNFTKQTNNIAMLSLSSTTSLQDVIPPVCDRWLLRSPLDPPDIFWVGWYAVGKDMQNKGIGRLLMKHLFGIVKKMKAKYLCVYMQDSKQNPVSRFYSKFGFVERGRIENYYENGDDLVYMARRMK